MPKLSRSTIARREAQLALALAALCAGKTVAEACAEANLDESTFRRWASTSPEYVALVRELFQEISRLRLITLISADQQILEQLIQNAKDPNVGPKARLAIHKHVHQLLEQVAKEQHTIDDHNAQEFLKTGPVLQKGSSRLTANIDGNVTITIESSRPNQVDVEDAEFESIES